jgi:lipopolysaccharide/colanic/teichoic acid biosynthesis glycosyltransferase
MASLTAWGNYDFSSPDAKITLLGTVTLAYFGALWANSRMLIYPVRDGTKVIFASVGIAFLIALVVVALGRLYYSRSFLLTAFLISLGWQWLGFWFLDKAKLRLAVIPGKMVEELLRLRAAEWVLLAKPTGTVTAAGIVTDADTVRTPEWVRFLADCALRGIPIYDAILVYETITGQVSLNHHNENIAHQCTTPPLYMAVKQIVDVVLVVASLPVVLPLIGLIALLIRLDSPGPAFFWQERVGKAGKVFCMVKFRTMGISDDQETPRFAVAEDHRVTHLGRWLRRFRLDELPQIWNVLRGEMSLSGPRPEQVPFAHLFAREIPLYPCRQLVKPGITGWAQVNHGYASGHEETRTKLAYDLYYVKHCSFWLDALIALRTLRTVITGYGAR